MSGGYRYYFMPDDSVVFEDEWDVDSQSANSGDYWTYEFTTIQMDMIEDLDSSYMAGSLVLRLIAEGEYQQGSFEHALFCVLMEMVEGVDTKFE
jgi:hypothetical protein